MATYKIYFSDNSEVKVYFAKSALSRRLKNCTIYNSEGYWKGNKEAYSFVIEYIGNEAEKQKIIGYIEYVKYITEKEGILLTIQEVESILI